MNKKYFTGLIFFFSSLYLSAGNTDLTISNYSNNKVCCSVDFLKKEGNKWVKGGSSTVHIAISKSYEMPYDLLKNKIQKITWYFEDLRGKPLSHLYCVEADKTYKDQYGTIRNTSFFNKPEHKGGNVIFRSEEFAMAPVYSKRTAEYLMTLLRPYNEFICAPLIQNPDGSVFFDIK